MSWEYYIEKNANGEDPVAIAENLIDKYNLKTESRLRDFVYPRQYLMYFLCNKSTLSKSVIGSMFNKDHATVIHAEKSVDAAIETNDPIFFRHAGEIRSILDNYNFPDRVEYHGNTDKVRVQILLDKSVYEGVLSCVKHKEITASRFIKDSIKKSLSM